MKYIYPRLPGLYCFPFFRIGGSGLANCLFVYARAVVRAQEEHLQMITPTWFNLGMGTYLRGQKDKRHYLRLFRHVGEISGLKKVYLLLFKKESMVIERGIRSFFVPLLGHSGEIRDYMMCHIHPRVMKLVDDVDFKNCVAVHVRLGDFPKERRIPLSWYKDKILRYGGGKEILLFSDGYDEELAELLQLPNVRRAFMGNAMADIIAMSRCCYLIGSDSSFSAWAAFLGQMPSCFYRLQYGCLLEKHPEQQIVEHEYK